jgi:hypothetical protein
VPWAVFVLLLANIALGGYLIAGRTPPGVQDDVRALEVNADKVTPVRASDAQASAPADAPATAAPAKSAAKPAASACLEWGAFAAAELERAQADLGRLGADRSSVRDLGLAPAWWVHVPPLRSREEAQARAREIEAAGMGDVQVVADGERWRNSVSLGIFRTEEAAHSYLARMREARVRNAAVAQRNDLLRLSSVLIVEPTPALVARIAELRATYPGTELRAVACPPGSG